MELGGTGKDGEGWGGWLVKIGIDELFVLLTAVFFRVGTKR